MSLTLTDILRLLKVRGQRQYGREGVSQLEHALQTAHLAELAGESAETTVAALIHDLGHLLAAERDGLPEDDTTQDDLHQYIALPFLRGLFPDAVLEPIRLHVDAKRYLCLIEPQYESTLSAESRHSLQLQGGVFSEQDGERFIAQPYATEAVRLRRYDDLAKTPGKSVPGLDHYSERMQQVCL